MAVCKARDLAHYIVDKCTHDDEPVSNLQLQKMMYFLQYVHCRNYGGLLFDDEEFEAWQYGPVLPSIYKEFSNYGGRAITAFYKDADRVKFGDLADWIDAGIEVLREKSPWDLVSVAHAKGSPWDRVWRGGCSSRRGKIPNEYIMEDARTV